jgi:hypothetical protein
MKMAVKPLTGGDQMFARFLYDRSDPTVYFNPTEEQKVRENAEYFDQKNAPPGLRYQLYEQLNKRGCSDSVRDIIVNIAEDTLGYNDPSITIDNVLDTIVLPDGWL